jgi:hypothetical protein
VLLLGLFALSGTHPIMNQTSFPKDLHTAAIYMDQVYGDAEMENCISQLELNYSMTAREIEAALLTRCTVVVANALETVHNQCEANVFHLAAMVVKSRFPRESLRLLQASDTYFATHPDERLTTVDVIRKGWVQSLPRLRDILSQRLQGR